MVILYVKSETPRTQYTFRLVFELILGIRYEVTSDEEYFSNAKYHKINYSKAEIPGSLHILPEGLLNEQELIHHDVGYAEWNKLPVIFPVNNSEFPFDLFSAVFYMVSRYEEYLPFRADRFGRFEADQSLAFRHGFLQVPVVDLWCRQLARTLGIQRSCPGLKAGNYRFNLTVDVDQAWFYRHRKPLLLMRKLGRDVLLLNLREVIFKLQVLLGKRTDPGDSFDYLLENQRKLPTKIDYFILCSHTGKFDNNLPLSNRHMTRLVKSLHNNHPIGLHPSFGSNDAFRQLKKEYNDLREALGESPLKSRQHYLMLTLPDTYRNLIKLGIQHDFSMGFAAKTGFRAGIARPFFFYDLYEERETSLVVHPFQVMDRTLQQYQSSTIEAACDEMKYYTDTIREIGGEFCALWHNTSLTETYEWKGWRKVFESMIALNTKA